MNIPPASQIHPVQAMEALRIASNPLASLVLVQSILSRYTELLDPHMRTLFWQILKDRYPDMLQFTRSQKVSSVKRTMSRVALAVNEREESVVLWYEAFTHGDIESLFDLLDFLIRDGDYQRAVTFVADAHAFSIDSYIVREDFPQEQVQYFYQRLIAYAYDLGVDSLADDMIEFLEWERIGSDDPRILQYKKLVRTPEEFDFALWEIWRFHVQDDKTANTISSRNIHEVERYIRWQLHHLWQYGEIESAMLTHLTEGIVIDVDTEQWYDYRKMQWQLFFQMRMFFLLAVIYRNETAADTILQFLDDRWDEAVDMLAHIVDSMNNPTDDESIDDISAQELIYSEVLLPMLDMFQWLEHAGLQSRIVDQMMQYAPMEAREVSDIYTSRNITRQYHLSSRGIAPYYLTFRNTLDEKHTPVTSKSIIDGIIFRREHLVSFWEVDLFVYYLVEYIMLYGETPEIEPNMITFIQKNITTLTELERDFLGEFYPQYFL